MIDLKDKDKAKVLADLYNAATSQGMGIPHYRAQDMTVQQAQKLLDTGQTYFGYVHGRVMKIDLSENTLDSTLYDRDNGLGAAAAAISD